jgi:hypothetical protein
VNKTETVQRLREAIGVEPREKGGAVFFELDGVYLCDVSGDEDWPELNYATKFKPLVNDGGPLGLESLLEKPESILKFLLAESSNGARLRKKLEFALKAKIEGALAHRNVTVPDGDVSLTKFEYRPGGKWECGVLNLEASTPLGPFVWEEVVPGPRHGDVSAELIVTLNGVKLDFDELYEYGLAELDFEPPRKPGKRADQFAGSRDVVAEDLTAWFRKAQRLLALVVGGGLED